MPDKVAKLEAWAEHVGVSRDEGVALFARLLSLPVDGFAPLTMTPERQRQKTVQAILTVLTREASQQRLLLVVEGLHWADVRPVFEPPWKTASSIASLALERLERDDVELMIEQLTGGVAFPRDLTDRVVPRRLHLV